MEQIEEGISVDEIGNILRGIHVFNVPVGEEEYVAAVLREKARKVESTTRRCMDDLEEKYPHELWTIL